ncbi:hypothetical protein HK097_009592 [Rhizophlyctis rosea]|uniref:Uncharacterized protein n=1 Tax=Rhizophlyctis rosea TaxID=64517 RepID=A0AAD5S8P1_9FUNG|nr:hypothetical protein HK097_009592 [Rhizophlyctis rosea]
MPRVIPVTLIGVLAGRLWASALHDHVWWPYLFTAEPGSLKSKVTAIQRSEAMNFYHSWATQPPKFLYATLIIVALVALSLLAALLQKPTQKPQNLASLLSFLAFIGIQALKVVPQIPKFQYHTRPTPDKEAAMLFDLAFWNALSLAAIVGTILFQIVAEDEEGEVRVKKRKKVRAEVVEVKKD